MLSLYGAGSLPSPNTGVLWLLNSNPLSLVHLAELIQAYAVHTAKFTRFSFIPFDFSVPFKKVFPTPKITKILSFFLLLLNSCFLCLGLSPPWNLIL